MKKNKKEIKFYLESKLGKIPKEKLAIKNIKDLDKDYRGNPYYPFYIRIDLNLFPKEKTLSEYYLEVVDIDELLFELGYKIINDKDLFRKRKIWERKGVIVGIPLIIAVLEAFKDKEKKIFNEKLFVEKQGYGMGIRLWTFGPFIKILLEPLFYDKKSFWGEVLKRFKKKIAVKSRE